MWIELTFSSNYIIWIILRVVKRPIWKEFRSRNSSKLNSLNSILIGKYGVISLSWFSNYVIKTWHSSRATNGIRCIMGVLKIWSRMTAINCVWRKFIVYNYRVIQTIWCIKLSMFWESVSILLWVLCFPSCWRFIVVFVIKSEIIFAIKDLVPSIVYIINPRTCIECVQIPRVTLIIEVDGNVKLYCFFHFCHNHDQSV